VDREPRRLVVEDRRQVGADRADVQSAAVGLDVPIDVGEIELRKCAEARLAGTVSRIDRDIRAPCG
jgi:hypothetical protein